MLLAVSPLIGTSLIVAADAHFGMSQHLSGGGWIAALIILLGGSLAVGLAFFVTHALSLVAGWALGFWVGLPIALTAWTLAACITYGIGRLLAGQDMERFIRRHRKLRALHDLFLSVGMRREATLVFLLRVSPVLPFTTTNVLLASAGVPLKPYAIGTFLGKAPQGVAVVFIGSKMQQLDLDRPEDAWLTWLTIGLTIVGCVLIGLIGRRAWQRVQ